MTVKEAINELKYSRDMCYFDPSTGETGKPYSEDSEEKAADEWNRRIDNA